MFVVGTVKDHVAPWRSVYKIHLLTDTDVTFVLTTGGHNAGIVSEPGHPHRAIKWRRHAEGDRYIDPETWQATTPHQEGSWWPAWQAWLEGHSSGPVAVPAMGAPGCRLSPARGLPRDIRPPGVGAGSSSVGRAPLLELRNPLMKTVSLEGKKGLIFGIANSSSLAYGCARAFRDLGAELAVTYRGPKAEPYVRPLAEELASPIIMPCDVREPGQLEAVFKQVGERWGRLDFLLHSIAFAPKEDLHGRVVDCSAGRLRAGHGRVVPFVHPDGEACRAPHDGRGMPADPDVLRVREGRRALQRDGAGEGGTRERRPVHGRRTRPEGDSGPCHLARAR